MLSANNSSVETCVGNLVRTVRGEVPFERTKGLDPDLIDAPLSEADVEPDVLWAIENFEDRIDADDVEVELAPEDPEGGDFGIKVVIDDERDEPGYD